MPEDYRLAVKKVIPVGAGPHGHLAYAGEVNQVWVLNGGARDVTVLDGRTGDSVGRIDVGGTPLQAIMDPAAGAGYITLAEDAVVFVDVRTGTVTKRIALPPGAGRSCMVPMQGDHRLYIAAENLESVQVIDTERGEIVGSFAVGKRPLWGQPHKKTSGKLYFVNADSNDVTIVDHKTEQVIKTVPVGLNPTRAAIFREQGQVYTADLLGGTVTGIDIAEDYVRAKVDVGVRPSRLVGMEKKTGRPELWVLNLGSDDVPAGLISVVDSSENEALAPVPVMDRPSNWLFEGPIGHVVSNASKQMMVVDSRSRSIVDEVALPEPPDAESFSNMVMGGDGVLFLANETATVTMLTPVG
jgi:YVTN family beta-propeller protein